MACLLIAAWTSVVAVVALGDRPGWALVFAGIAGFALGIELMVVFFEDMRNPAALDAGRGGRLRVVRGRGPLRSVRRPNGALSPATGGNTAAAPRSGRT